MSSKLLKGLRLSLGFLGIFPTIFSQNMSAIPWYIRDYRALKRQLKAGGTGFKLGVPMPQLRDKASSSGSYSGHYFHQDLLVAQQIFKNNPIKHVDIGSRTDGFVTHVASFREIEVFDIREYNHHVSNIRFVQADFMQMSDQWVGYTDSLSCLHVIEHFGLGRYGDPIDADGHLKGLENMKRMLKTGGKFYFSTPIGPQRINFNAHRVFNVKYLLELFTDDYILDRFSYVDDQGVLHQDADPQAGIQTNFGCKFGCGIFELTKR